MIADKNKVQCVHIPDLCNNVQCRGRFADIPVTDRTAAGITRAGMRSQRKQVRQETIAKVRFVAA
jgi:hypothetical protein